ncbi:uncharacterized protein STEHIDRAFT_116876 [Stereum hirsutum FP-91666 SS1]|uniref:uncharacterized protein n=1 Tax=Stereum hirsutum (strain FP-91666) TaxID=721885 RepID=UPI000440D3B2|nr:uncharacterized protein STEHIDRAFT_116876 [Stereum hirsutum FP-91666 SS1]EIM91703.1 hypothetical protein STEHIDRAFT_116876 [Stereum hirsutum FP-91666 SS1]
MELSIDDILRMPRESAGPLLERMINKSKHVRNENLTLAAQVRTLEADKAALEERLESLMGMKTEELPSMNFGFVYRDHEELVQTLQDQEQKIAELQSENVKAKEKLKFRKDEIKRLTDLYERTHTEDDSQANQGDRESRPESYEKDLGTENAKRDESDLVLERHKSEHLQTLLSAREREINRLRSPTIPVRRLHDPMAFLKKENCFPISHPTVHELKPLSVDWARVRPKLPEALCTSQIYTAARHGIVLKAPQDISSALLISPHQTITPEPVRRFNCHVPFKTGDVFDLVFEVLNDNQEYRWYYAGRYKCMFFSVMPLKYVSSAMPKHIRPYLREQIFGSLDTQPRTLRKFIHNIFDSGVLEVHCFGIHRVGYDSALSSALHASATSWMPLPETLAQNVSVLKDDRDRKRKRSSLDAEGAHDTGEEPKRRGQGDFSWVFGDKR